MEKQIYIIDVCVGEEEETSYEVQLTQEDVEVIESSIRGEYNAEYLIQTEDGPIDVGIIDSIRKVG